MKTICVLTLNSNTLKKVLTGIWLALTAIGLSAQVSTAAPYVLAHDWEKVPNSGKVIDITVLPDGSFLGVGMNFRLYHRNSLFDKWREYGDAAQLKSIFSTPNGTLLAAGTNNKFYTKVPGGEWTHDGTSGRFHQVTAGPSGELVGVGTNNVLYVFDTGTKSWQRLNPSDTGRFVRATFMSDGTLLAVGTNNKIYRKELLNLPWEPVAGNYAVVSVAEMHDGTIVATGTNNELYRTAFRDPFGMSRRQLDGMLVDRLVQRFGPIMKMHPNEKFMMDDPDAVLDSGRMNLVWGIVRNGCEDCYDTFELEQTRGLALATSADLPGAVEAAHHDPNANDPNFKMWLQFPTDTGFLGGQKQRAKALVIAKPGGEHVDLQFFFFYPFNGPGKFRLRVGKLQTEHESSAPAGRHYGDWEHVTLRLVPIQSKTGNEWRISNMYLSRHNLSSWYPTSAIQFRASQPVIYVARDSHAHYPTVGRHYYTRPFSQSFIVGTASVDLEDITGDGYEVDTAARYRIVHSELPDFAVDEPIWWGFPGRWGQRERLKFSYEIKDPLIGHLYTYDMKMVGAGPSGPAFKTDKPLK